MKALLPNAQFELEFVERDIPEPAAGEVLVEVKAFGLNRADLSQIQGKYPAPPGVTDIPGLELSGIVKKCGDGVNSNWLGKRVCALVPGGAYAEHAVCSVDTIFEIPSEWSYSYAAAIPETFLTGFLNIFVEGRAARGESLLIHGGSSGVGTAGIQLASQSGISVFVTAGSDEKCVRCRELGATDAINYKEADFVHEIKKITNDAGVDVILDCIGADYFQKNLSLLKSRGRLVCIAVQSGRKSEVDIGQLMAKRLSVIGSVLRSRTLEEKRVLCAEFRTRFWPQLLVGTVNPVIDSIIPWNDIGAALNRMKSFAHFGKIILEIQ